MYQKQLSETSQGFQVLYNTYIVEGQIQGPVKRWYTGYYSGGYEMQIRISHYVTKVQLLCLKL